MKDRRQHSATTTSDPFKEIVESNISKSKAFLQQYRSVSQEIMAARDGLHRESCPKENIEYLQSLLDRRSERLRVEIHAILRNEDLTEQIHHEDKVEKELWGRFGAVSTALKPVEHDAWRHGGVWTESTRNSTRALRRLVKYLPEEM